MANTYAKHSLVDVAVLYIKDKILSGELKSGDKLIESDISADLEISRAPLREALRELNAQGLISFSPRKGNQVLEMAPREVLEVFEIRTSLEQDILRIIVEGQMLSSDDFTNLSDMTEEMASGECMNEPSPQRLYRLNHLDISFHSYLWNASRSTRRAQFLEGLFYQLLISMNKDVVTLGSFEEKAREHASIIEALRSGDLEKVLQVFGSHLREYVEATLPENAQDHESTPLGRLS